MLETATKIEMSYHNWFWLLTCYSSFLTEPTFDKDGEYNGIHKPRDVQSVRSELKRIFDGEEIELPDWTDNEISALSDVICRYMLPENHQFDEHPEDRIRRCGGTISETA